VGNGSKGPAARKGQILEQFLTNTIDYLRTGFENPDKQLKLYAAAPSLGQLEQWSIN
jgi:hypothetical protein